MAQKEIDDGAEYIGYNEALALVHSNIRIAGTERLPLSACPGYLTAEKVVALVDSPTNDISLKDGFAVKVEDVSNASPAHPVSLDIVGSVYAGGKFQGKIVNGQAVKICSGSPLPDGSDAVLSSEFCQELSSKVLVMESENEGKNIFRAGDDVRAGEVILEEGRMLLPACLSLAAAAGISHLTVYRKPLVSLLAIGDEVVALGHDLKEGQLFASNVVNIGSWLACLQIPYFTSLTGDNSEGIRRELTNSFSRADAIITSGGAWGSERDLIVKVLDGLGWNKLFNHVRLGPGKGVAFGIWGGKPVFCLPGGPPSNELAFLQLALPGILRLAGQRNTSLITVPARLTENLKRRHLAWTEYKKAKLAREADGTFSVTPFYEISRLKHMAESDGLICIPEGVEALYRNQIVSVQVMTPAFISNLP
jgi:molybdopterin molybdotransferase